MNVFGVGPAELIVVLIVALVFVGPERLPRLAADLARTIREIRKYTGALQSEFTEYVKEVEKETAGERNEWKQIEEGIGSATQSVTEALRSARTAADGTPAPVNGTPVPAAAAAAASTAPAASDPEWKEIGAGLAEASTPGVNGHAPEATLPGNGAAPAANGTAPVATPPTEERA